MSYVEPKVNPATCIIQVYVQSGEGKFIVSHAPTPTELLVVKRRYPNRDRTA